MKAREVLVIGGMLTIVAACVGDDPSTNGTTAPDGDGGTGADATTGGGDGGGGGSDASGDAGCGDTQTSHDNCGACGKSCAAGFECLGGRCGNEVTTVGIHEDASCVSLRSGDVWCWGDNTYGTLGTSPSAGKVAPQKVPNLANVVQVDVFERTACALDKSGGVSCWGKNDAGELGRAPINDSDCTDRKCNHVPSQVTFPGGAKIAQLAVGASYSGGRYRGTVCARSDVGKVYCWGSSGGLVAGADNAQISPFEMPAIVGATDIAVGWGEHACAIVTGGQVMCWGVNNDGQLGHVAGGGTPIDVSDTTECGSTSKCNATPQAVGSLTGAVKVAVGNGYSCAAKNDGTVFCWGTNKLGNLGTGNGLTNTSTPTPSQVVGASGAKTIFTRNQATYALDAMGKLSGWGDTTYGELGTGARPGITCLPGMTCVTSAQSAAPSVGEIVRVSTGVNAVGALRSDGTVWVWGYGSYGNGDIANCYGTATCNATPQKQPGLP